MSTADRLEREAQLRRQQTQASAPSNKPASETKGALDRWSERYNPNRGVTNPIASNWTTDPSNMTGVRPDGTKYLTSEDIFRMNASVQAGQGTMFAGAPTGTGPGPGTGLGPGLGPGPGSGSRGSGSGYGGPVVPPELRDAYQYAWHHLVNAPEFPTQNINFVDQNYINSLYDQGLLDSLYNEGLLNQMRDTRHLDQMRAGSNQAIDRILQMVANGEAQGKQLLEQLLQSGQTTLRDVLGRLDERLGTARIGIDEAFGAASQRAAGTAEQMAALEASDAAYAANAAEQFGFTPSEVQGSGDIAAQISGLNEAQRSAMNAAMADRTMMYGGLDFDVSNQLQRDYSNRMYDLRQQSEGYRIQGEMQRMAVEAQYVQQKHQQMMQAAVAEHDMIVAQAQAKYGMTQAQAEAAYQQNLQQMQFNAEQEMRKFEYEMMLQQRRMEMAIAAGSAGVNLGLGG